MRRLTALLFFFNSFLIVQAQQEGVVTYESLVIVDLERFPKQFRDRISPERKSEKKLFFNDKESLYKHSRNIVDMDREVGFSGPRGGGSRFRGMGGADNNECYYNRNEGIVIDKVEFFGRTFLISEENKLEWKVTSEMSSISGYQCIKATTMKDTIPVTAWFTPQVPVPIGPGEYTGLPGLIMKVDINSGTTTLTATNVDLRVLTEEEKIAQPDKGKEISREEFEKIQKEKRAEMEEMRRAYRRGRG